VPEDFQIRFFFFRLLILQLKLNKYRDKKYFSKLFANLKLGFSRPKSEPKVTLFGTSLN